MQKVKRLIEAGASIPTAIKESLTLGVGELAAKYGLPRPTVSAAINGLTKPTDALVAALIAELGGSEAEWRDLLWLAAKPETSAA